MPGFPNKFLHSMTIQKKRCLVWGFWCTAKRIFYTFLTLGLASLFERTKLSTKLNERRIIHLLSGCATSLLLLAWHFLDEAEWRRKGKCLSLHWCSCQQHPSTSIYCLPLQFGLVYHIGINFIPMVNTAKKSALFRKKLFKSLGLIQILPACKQVIYKQALSKHKTKNKLFY